MRVASVSRSAEIQPTFDRFATIMQSNYNANISLCLYILNKYLLVIDSYYYILPNLDCVLLFSLVQLEALALTGFCSDCTLFSLP